MRLFKFLEAAERRKRQGEVAGGVGCFGDSHAVLVDSSEVVVCVGSLFGKAIGNLIP